MGAAAAQIPTVRTHLKREIEGALTIVWRWKTAPLQKCSRQLQVWASLEGLPRLCVLPLQWLASSAARVCLTRHTHPTPELSRADPLTQTDDWPTEQRQARTGRKRKRGRRRGCPQSAPHTHEYKYGWGTYRPPRSKIRFCVGLCVVLCREVDWNDWRVVSAVSGIHLVVVGRGESQQRACRDRHW